MPGGSPRRIIEARSRPFKAKRFFMNFPYRFPDPLQEAARRAEEFRRLSPDERWREIASLMELGFAMIHESPRREWIQKRMAEQESQWQRSQRELFEHYG